MRGVQNICELWENMGLTPASVTRIPLILAVLYDRHQSLHTWKRDAAHIVSHISIVQKFLLAQLVSLLPGSQGQNQVANWLGSFCDVP